MSSPSYAALVALAHDLADQSAKVALPHFRKRIPVDDKGARLGAAFDPVTKADRAAEKVISKLIRDAFPEHGIIGEEFGATNPDARFQWVIDPIDGTRAFITGSPMWGTLIGLLDEGQPVFGMINHPFSRERCWTGANASFQSVGEGKGQRIRTRPCGRLEDAFLMSTSPDLFAKGAELRRFQAVKARARMTRFGGDCYAYMLLASGLIDVVVEAGLQPYDVVALIPVIEKAGGRITTWDGKSAASGGRIVASGDARLHDEVLELLSG